MRKYLACGQLKMCVRVCRPGLYNVSWDDDLVVSKWIPCRSEEPGALRWTMHELAMGGFSSQIVAPAVLMMDVRDVIARHKPSVSMEDLSSTEGSMRSLAGRAGHEDTQREYSIGTEEILHEYGWLLFLGRSRIRASKLERLPVS